MTMPATIGQPIITLDPAVHRSATVRSRVGGPLHAADEFGNPITEAAFTVTVLSPTMDPAALKVVGNQIFTNWDPTNPVIPAPPAGSHQIQIYATDRAKTWNETAYFSIAILDG